MLRLYGLRYLSHGQGRGGRAAKNMSAPPPLPRFRRTGDDNLTRRAGASKTALDSSSGYNVSRLLLGHTKCVK